jgi:hypothetical protein
MYLLLRNNKQTGPHSLEELKNMGLKAYDLIWLEGKSAAWRYPCELEELKPFAPVVEEQPFDRFYKRPVQVAATTDYTPAPAAESTRPAQTMIQAVPSTPQVFAGEPSTQPGKRIIYVTMPAGKSPTPIREREPAREPVTRESVSRESGTREPAARESITQEPVSIVQQPTPATRPAIPAPATRAAIEDYSVQPEFRDHRNVEFAPQSESRRNNRRNTRILRPLAIAGSVLILLCAGIFIGFSLSKEGIGLPPKTVVKTPETGTTQPIEHVPAQQTSAPAGTNSTGGAAQGNETGAKSPADVTEQNKTRVTSPGNTGNKPPRITMARAKENQVPAKNLATLPPAGKDSTANIPIVHREAIHRADVAEDKPENTAMEAARTALPNEVSIGTNSYSVGTFGGINDLQLTVTNRSSYPLDLVVVEVQYIQANKKVYKTENLYFRSIGAGSALMQEAPKSSRGVKVQYRIINISSKELGLSYSGI